MKEYVLSKPDHRPLAEEWLQHEFYRSAIVLGIDIGLEGIGIYLRRGLHEVFARSVILDLPDAEALASRRQKRAWRHCRKNRRRRMHRLKLLFVKHGLPWLDAGRMSKAHPFRERHRAINGGVASKEALSICIRHCVMHRGYDYGGTEEGAFPWGESPSLSKATEWLNTAYVTRELKENIEDIAPLLLVGRNEEEQHKRFADLLQARMEWSAQHDIARVLADHCKGGHDNLRTRARGFNFPRQKVWEHLEAIVRKHAHLIDDAEGFLAVLGLDPNRAGGATQQDRLANAAHTRRKAIFFYNRKTRAEMEQHWAKKVNTCPFAGKLGGNPDERCAENGDLNIRCWKTLEFTTTRRVEVEVTEGKGETKKTRRFLHALSGSAARNLVEFVKLHHAAANPGTAPKWDEGKDIVLADIKGAHGDRAKPVAETKSDWNKSYFTQLKDLLTPTLANRKKRASLSAAAAGQLLKLATAGESDFQPASVVGQLREAGFYDWRRNASTDFNPYPQVELLVGRRIKRGKRRGELATVKHDGRDLPQGLLHRIFEEHRDALGGATAPDYCVLEVIGDAPRNAWQRAERQKEIIANREKRDKRFEQFNLQDSGVVSKRRRIALWDQQHGKCPYTGNELPANPLDQTLEIEHIFPAEMGGLSVDDNLVLTWRTVNAEKGKRTPLQFAGAAFEQMLGNTKEMKWSARKQELFTWGTNREERPDRPSHYNGDGSLRVPDFGNTTRMAQLARQLRAEVMCWMQVDDKPDEAAKRIGTPSGWLAAQARKSWLPKEEYEKVRNNMTHHLIDAAVLAHIPPREGMNSVEYKGIFYVEKVPGGGNGNRDFRLETKALPELSPLARLKHWLPGNGEYAVNPVLKRRRESKTQSLGDATFWRQVRPTEGRVAQRETLEKAVGGKNVPTADALIATLQSMGIPGLVMPKRADLQAWLDQNTATTKSDKDKPLTPLKLTDGTPVKNLWKFDSKGSLASPVGWTGKRNANGTLRELRSISLKYDRLELWLGYDAVRAERARKAKRDDWQDAGWIYQKRLIPDARALRHVKQMGFSFGRDKRRVAPAYMQDKPDQPETHKTLRALVLGGALLPFSRKVGVIRKGDEFKLSLLPDGSVRKRTPAGQPQPAAALTTFYVVTALKQEGVIKLTSLLFKDKEGTEMSKFDGDVLTRTVQSADDIAFLLGLASAMEEARKGGRRIPATAGQDGDKVAADGNLL